MTDSGRLRDPKPLTLQEMIDLLPQSITMSEDFSKRLQLEVAIKAVQATNSFEQSSSRLGCRMLWLTVVMAVMTAAILGFTIVLAYHH